MVSPAGQRDQVGRVRSASTNLQALGLPEPHKLVQAVLPGQRAQGRFRVQGNLLKLGQLGGPGQAVLSLHPELVPRQGVPSFSHQSLGHCPTP